MNPPGREVALFSAALELPADQRTAYLEKACADDPALRLRLEALLGVHAKAITFLETSVAAAADSPMSAEVSAVPESRSIAPAEKAGDRIGRYKLLQQIGEGGCGVVYMAEQQEPVRRRVALKVVKLGMDTKQVIGRFEAERQALALMDHPNIAKVLEAGATDTGRPFFVMELVRGIKITEYCDQRNLSTKERLDLFTQVCRAVQHAHQKGIIHRDLKPSNILVASDDGVPVPKVIDFGIAKATQGRLTDQTVFTAFEQFIGTPAYMSPEQAELTMQEIDTRTDIYSLGVLLYELLTGKTPLDQKELLAVGLDEMRRTIREKEPVRPSTRLSTMLEGELTTTARQRHIDAPKLIHLLRGDLDWIVMKALEKDRARRYETANGLAMDVQRHLADEPVVARPPSNLYRFQKLARRNKLAFAAIGAVAAALVIGFAASTWEYFNERKARQRAVAAEQEQKREAAKAIAIGDTLGLLLSSADPDHLRRPDYTVRQLLDDYVASGLTNQFAGQPDLEAAVRHIIGWTYFRLGVFSKAEPNLRRSLTLRRGALGPQHPDTLAVEHALGMLLIDGLRQWQEGEGLAREAWQGRQQTLGPENPYTLASQELYSKALLDGGKLQEAEAIQRKLLETTERVLGPDQFDTICSIGNFGMALEERGAWTDAERYLQEARARFQRNGLADQLDALICVKELAMLRLLQGDPTQAERVLVELLPRAVRSLGPDHYVTLHIQRVLARVYAEEGRFVEAGALCKETLKARQRTKADQERMGTGYTLLYLGRVLVEQGKLDEAEPVLQEARTILSEANVVKPELAAQAANWLGVIEIGRKAYPEAEALMLPGSDCFFSTNAVMSPNEHRLAVNHIVKLYEAWDRPKEAADWQKKLDKLAATASNR